MDSYKIDKLRCLGCGGCTVRCPEGIDITEEGKAVITDSKEVKRCGGEELCPYRAIIKKKSK